MKPGTIYKLLTRAEWEVAQAEGVYRGSSHDVRDGFIHFSTAAQLRETARKYFAGAPDLVLLAADVEALNEAGIPLRWEPARGGGLFPHLYGYLPLGAVISSTPVPPGVDGVPAIPPEIAL